jgi:16S rRNA (guanine966-N2)-methyltransferase
VLRITGGEFRGRKLKTLPGLATRPTAGRVKEALFSILGGEVSGAEVLDLFAGSGALGLEALSRGAQHVVFVERDKKAAALIRANCETLGTKAVEVVCADVFSWLAHRRGAFDLIFLDPPYRQSLARRTLDLLNDNSLLKYKGVVVVETAADETLCDPTGANPEDWFQRECKYGECKISLLRRLP